MSNNSSKVVFIVGCMKRATTSLYHFLDHCPTIKMSPIKEPQYFFCKAKGFKERVSVISFDYFEKENLAFQHQAYVNDWKWYKTLFNNFEENKIFGEAIVSYIQNSDVPNFIKAQFPNAKIIAVLREPFSRTISHFEFNLKMKNH